MAVRGKQILRPNGMVTDLARELMKSDMASFLKNVITDYNKGVGDSGQDHNLGLSTPVLSNVNSAEYDGDFPLGTSLCIGTHYDRKLNQFFWFLWNDSEAHQVWVYDAITNVATLILETFLFNFSPRDLITSINVIIANISVPDINVQDFQRLLYWTDGNNEPRVLNVDRAIAGEYPAVPNMRTLDQFMLVVQYPPLDCDFTTTLPNPDPAYLYNFVQNKLFQFRYRFHYEDGTLSVWSAISSLAYSIITSQNFVELNMSAGAGIVEKVELAFRETNIGDWKSYDIILRSDIVANVIYPYDNTTNTFTYQFFNNQQYNILDQEDTNRPFDFVPLKAKAQEFTEINNLLYGNILEGYNNIDPAELLKPAVNVNYEEYAPLTLAIALDINFSWTGTGTFTMELVQVPFDTGIVTVVHTWTVAHTDPSPHTYTASIAGVSFGDLIYVRIGTGNVNASIGTRELTGTYTNITNPQSCGTGDFDVTNTHSIGVVAGVTMTFDTVVDDDCATWSTSTNKDTVSNYTNTFHILKQGGVYRFGIIAYDAALRSTFVQLLDRGHVTIETIQENGAFQTNSITVDWNDMVLPDQFQFIKLCRTKNLVIDRTLGMGYLQTTIINVVFLMANNVAGNPVTDIIKNIEFNINPLITFNTDNYENTTTTYTWTQGDRIQFIRNGNGTYFTFANFGFLDVPLSTDPTTPNVNFRCEYTAELLTLVDNAWVQLYTPAKSEQTDIYYEIGDYIPLTQVPSFNIPAVTSTTINTFDTYPIFWNEPYVDDTVDDNGATPFEHHSVYATKIVPSNGEDIGKINVVNPDARQLWYPATIRWSFVYIPNTFYNGLSSFKEDNKKDFFREYGGITQLCVKYYELLLLQETNVFRVNIGRSLVTLADGSTQLVASSSFLSDPINIDGDFGCQNSESFIDADEFLFWVDTERAAICKSDWRSVVDIARESLFKSYAERKLKYISSYNANEYKTQTCTYDMTGMPPVTTADNFIKIQVNGVWHVLTPSGTITDAAGISGELNMAGDIGAFGSNGDLVTIYAPEFSYGDLILTSNEEAQEVDFTATLTCTLDFFNVLGGYDPKHKLYLDTFFNVNNKPSWTWDLSAGFTTGDAVDLIIEVQDSPVDFGNLAIESIDDIIYWLNLGLPPDTFSIINNGTTILVISNSGYAYGTLTIGEDTFEAIPNYKLCTYTATIPIGDIEPGGGHYPLDVNFIKNGNETVPVSVASDIELVDYFESLGFIWFGGTNNLLIMESTADVWASVTLLYESDDTVSFPFVTSDCNLLQNQYTNNEYNIAIARNETIAYSIREQFFKMYSYTPEYFCFNDGNLESLSLVSFKQGTPFFHNLNSVTTYNTFYDIETDQIITVVCNDQPNMEKRFLTISIDTKNKTSSINGTRYGGYAITTSDKMNSSIPIDSFKFLENFYYSVFYRNTSLGGTLFTGQPIRGTWSEITLVRDTELRTIYNELAKIIINFESSERTNR